MNMLVFISKLVLLVVKYRLIVKRVALIIQHSILGCYYGSMSSKW